MKFGTFIVHLKRATGRAAQVRDLVTKSPYDAQIVDAVDGAKLPETVLTSYYSGKSLFEPVYPFKLNVGEVGCFLSHRKVWKAIVEQKLDAGLIFEDDLHIIPNQFGPAVAIAERNIEKLGYIQFQVRNVPDQNQILSDTQNAKIVQPVVTPLRTSAQFVSRAAAERLLNLTQEIDRPIDGFLQLHWETGIHLSCVVPSGVSDRTAETGGSTLSAKHPLIKKLGRELKRSRYKTQIRKYSARSSDVIG